MVLASTTGLNTAWDETAVTGEYVTCDDGREKWRDAFEVPVTAELVTADELFSETLTGVLKRDPANLANRRLELDDLPLPSVRGKFGWRHVEGWRSESDICGGATFRFGALILDAKTNALQQLDETPGFLNLECPAETPPQVPFFALAGF